MVREEFFNKGWGWFEQLSNYINSEKVITENNFDVLLNEFADEMIELKVIEEDI